jgi:hypothetical protein
MLNSSSHPQHLVGRKAELQHISEILAADGDLLLAGVPGSGRHSLIRAASEQTGARVLEIDCLRATNANRFLELLAEGLVDTFNTPSELQLIQRWSANQPIVLERSSTRRARLVWHARSSEAWNLLQALLELPQTLAEWLECRVVLVFQNFPHLRSWDRGNQWESYLQQKIQQQSRVSYVVITTVVEDWAAAVPLEVIALGPLSNTELQPWIQSEIVTHGLQFESGSQALDLFCTYVQGHPGGAIALTRRIWLDHSTMQHPETPTIIQPHQVHRSTLALVEDLSMVFESLLLLLPPTQVRVLESLALDPTDSPHARDYIQKHQLSRGGGLQGALAALEQKGLLYDANYGYQIAMPFLAFWLKHRLA